jgi:predicted nucleotidyltransferase
VNFWQINKKQFIIIPEQNMNKVLQQIKNIIVSTMSEYEFPLDKIYLFGSKARGNSNKQSDYDLLLITKKDFNRDIGLQAIKKIRERLARFYIENHVMTTGTDIIIHSRKEIEKYKKSMGTVTYQALKEGILL